MILSSGTAARTGRLSKVKNEVDGCVYTVSTAESRGSWATLVFPAGFWGTIIGSFKPMIAIQSHSEADAIQAHHRIERVVDQKAPSNWPHWRR
jgi:hypothetical protein